MLHSSGFLGGAIHNSHNITMAKTNKPNSKVEGKGRPTLYKAEYAQKLTEFVDKCCTVRRVDEGGVDIRVKLPTVAGFLTENKIHVNKSTFFEWVNTHPDFSNAYTYMKNSQQEQLINNTLGGQFKANIGIFLLNVNHGMIPAQKTELEASMPIAPNLVVNLPTQTQKNAETKE